MIDRSRLALLLALVQTPALLSANFTLTLLHFNDAESHLLNAGNPEVNPDGVPTTNPDDLVNYGGAARFVTLVNKARADAKTDAVLTLSAGDNFLPGLALDASNPTLNKENPNGVNFDAKVFAEAGTDFTILGNHDFDLGPDYLATFLNSVRKDGGHMRTASCNLDMTAVPALAENVAPFAVFDFKGQKIGVVGATTWDLAGLSSPGAVKLIDADGDGDTDIDDTAILVQREIDRMTQAGINKILLVAHLQSVRNDQALLRKLRGVDVEISGGGHEVLASGAYATIPGAAPAQGTYPLLTGMDGQPVTDLDGKNVPVVTAGSGLDYLGRLVVEFDDAGNVLSASGGPLLVNATGPDAETPDAATNADVVEPVYSYIRDCGHTVVAVTEVDLDALREAIRVKETNLGDLVADAFLAEGQRMSAQGTMPSPVVALVNGGDFRCNCVVPKGNITNVTIKNIIPFANYVTVVEKILPENFKQLAEHMVGGASGCTGQIAGFKMVYDPKAPSGSRVCSLILDDGRVIVREGEIAANAPTVALATINYLARGGDDYPFDTTHAHIGSVLQTEALSRYVAENLGGKITRTRYPEGGLGRITAQ